MNNLKALRNKNNFKQSDIAEKLSITSQAYANYENELRDIPTKTLADLAIFFNCSIDFLLGKETSSALVSATDPDYVSMVNFWNKMDRGKKMMALGYMERLTEEPAKIVVNINKNSTTSGNKNGVNG